MGNLLEYLAWRGDLTLTQAPFCPVDGLVLSALAYVHLDGIAADAPIPLGEAAARFFALQENTRGRTRCKEDLSLLQALRQVPRFSGARLTAYEDRFEPEREMQFAAVTVLLDDGSAFLSFRGTDSTLVGWKEDFNMAFQDVVPAQQTAVDYLERFARSFSGPLRLGGHSKGGNLAVFAASQCGSDILSRITGVYNNDGPGVTARIRATPGYQAALPIVRTFVPQSSVIGMLLEHEEDYTVVQSTRIGLLQHDPYSWEILGGSFVQMAEVTAGSRITDRAIRTWLESMSPEERCRFVDGLFHVLAAGNITTLHQLLQPRGLAAALQALKSTDEQTRHMLAAVLTQLGKSAAEAILEEPGASRGGSLQS